MDHEWIDGKVKQRVLLRLDRGPAAGEYLTGRILGTQTPEPRFSFASKGTVQKRPVD